MLDLFQSRLEGTQESLETEQQLDFGQNMLKTQLLETNIEAHELFDETDSVDSTEEIDEDLFLVYITPSADMEASVFLDTYDDRFWTLYSMEDAKKTDQILRALLSQEAVGLDKPWLPGHQVEAIRKMGVFEGVRFSYDADEAFSESYVENNLRFSDLSVSTSGSGAPELYTLLQQAERIDDYLAMKSVQIRRQQNGDFVRERITNDGGFTTRGGSDIELHVNTVNQIKRRYAELLSLIEEHHRIDARTTPSGGRSEGHPVIIEFSQEISDIGIFLDNIISARDPFRLWGHVQKVEDDFYTINAVDMHNGDQVDIEVGESWMRLYLQADACGNTALRIFANLQQFYDPAADLVLSHD